jgi:hypothetical protein
MQGRSVKKKEKLFVGRVEKYELQGCSWRFWAVDVD